MSEAPGAPDWTEAGRRLFAGPCEFFFAAARSDGLPPVGAPEIVKTYESESVFLLKVECLSRFERAGRGSQMKRRV